jgi:hypothetical protein
MDPEIVIERLCSIPANFYGGNKSPVQLVAESGLSQCESAFSVEAVSTYLSHHPMLVEQWLRWSEDKRVSSGWYFMRESNKFVVGYYPRGETLSFTEALPACAEFVIREVQAIRA